MELGLRDRVCIVTGASGGIGKATAVALAREGAGALLVGRRRARLEELARACAQAGGQAEPAVIVFLCSEAASNVAGAAWSVDGGSVPVII